MIEWQGVRKWQDGGRTAGRLGDANTSWVGRFFFWSTNFFLQLDIYALTHICHCQLISHHHCHHDHKQSWCDEQWYVLFFILFIICFYVFLQLDYTQCEHEQEIDRAYKLQAVNNKLCRQSMLHHNGGESWHVMAQTTHLGPKISKTPLWRQRCQRITGCFPDVLTSLQYVFFPLIHIFVSKKISNIFCLICENFEKNLFNNVNLVNLFNMI